MAEPCTRSRLGVKNHFLMILCSLLLSACGTKDEGAARLQLPREPLSVSSNTAADVSEQTSTSTQSAAQGATFSDTKTVPGFSTSTSSQTSDHGSLRTIMETSTRTQTEASTATATSAEPRRADTFRLPVFNPAWGLKREIYEKAVREYEARRPELSNPRFVTVVDFSRHARQKRLFLFDLSNDRMHAFLTTHGFGSDPRHTGLAQSFSNSDGSRRSSLGSYITRGTYLGGHGYSLRLAGLDASNSNAAARLIVVHGAAYVNEKGGYAGRSNGCFALDPKLVRGVIDRIKGGSLIVADR